MFKLELKRIFSKKINLLVIGAVLLLAIVFSGFAVSSTRYVDESGNVSESISSARKLDASKNQWRGTLTEATLVKVIQQNKDVFQQYSENEINARYGTLLQPMDDIRDFMISVLTPDSDYDTGVLQQMTTEEARDFYGIYHDNMEKMAAEYGKTPAQKAFLQKQYSKIRLPLTYESFSPWSTMIMYAETFGIILAIAVGFLCAGIFADDFQLRADAVFFSEKYGRTKATRTKLLAGFAVTTAVYWAGIFLMSVICFGIMGVSGAHTPYQVEQAYSIYAMTYGQYYLLTVVCGYIASLLAASLSMLVAAKMHTISVAICVPFFLYCVLPFIGRALSQYSTFFNLIPTMLTNVEAAAKVPLVYGIGHFVCRQIPLVMVVYTVIALLLIPMIYRSFSRCGSKA